MTRIQISCDPNLMQLTELYVELELTIGKFKQILTQWIHTQPSNMKLFEKKFFQSNVYMKELKYDMITLKANGVTNQSVILIQSVSGEGLFLLSFLSLSFLSFLWFNSFEKTIIMKWNILILIQITILNDK